MLLRLLIYSTILIFFISCGEDDPMVDDLDKDLTDIEYNPLNYVISGLASFPAMEIPDDNPMTVQGVELGRFLFYDPILSADSSMSCASCHLPEGSFTDKLAVSTGIDDLDGKRSSMSLMNVGYYNTGLFWDGRADDLEAQALLPVEDPIELHHSWTELVKQLKRHNNYPELFRKAFGIERSSEITKELAAKAIAQFERTLISSGESKYDKVIAGKAVFTDQELMGFDIFFDNDENLPDGECFHCHNAPLLTTNEYINNGIDSSDNFEDFNDHGYGKVTGIQFDNGKFRVPTLRNIVHSAPYMHDGRFENLEQVLAHYNSGGKSSPNKHPLISPLNLTVEQIDAVLAFLHTLTDEPFIENPDHQDPN